MMTMHVTTASSPHCQARPGKPAPYRSHHARCGAHHSAGSHDAGVDEDLLWTLEVGTHTGEKHERYARYLDTCRDLASSEDPALARLGTRGVEIYEPRLAEAKAEARRAAVRGTHGF